MSRSKREYEAWLDSLPRAEEVYERQAAEDEKRAEELAEDSPSYADYLQKRAEWRRKLARDAEE